jgi:peptidoglycan hydrolase CwlO-like protein
VPAPAATADSNLSALTSQRAQLQAQVGRLSSDQASAVQQLLSVQDRLAELRRQVAHNQAQLAGVRQRHDQLVEQVAGARARIGHERQQLAAIARQQYKARLRLSADQVLFGSDDLNQVLNRVMAGRAISDRSHALVVDLRAVESALTRETSDLARREAELASLQADLAARRASMVAAAAEYQRRVDQLTESSSDLLQQINDLNARIAAANRPPSGSFSMSQQQVIAIIRAAAQRYGANGDQMVRVANCESSLNPRAYDSGSGASGLFQFMPGTFYAHGGHDIWDATDQSNVAAKMFAGGQADQWSCR